MKKIYKAHPLMILSRMKPFIFVLFLPFVRGLLQYMTDREITGILGVELTLFIGIVLFSILSWRSFRLIISDDSITVLSGFVFVKKATINISSLSSVQSERNILDLIARSVTYSINTEAGRKNKSDFKFKLWVKDSKEVSNLLYRDKTHKKFKFSVLKVAVLAATTSSAFSGMIIGVPIINKAGDLLGLALSEMLFDEINQVSGKFQTFFPPIVNVITLVLLLGYGISFIYSFLKYINFKLFLGDDKLEIRSGFFSRTRTSFRKSAINDVRIEQTPLMTLSNRYAMKVSVGGYGDSKSESAVIMPCSKKSEIKEGFSLYFPFLKPKGKKVRANQDTFTKSRFLFMPSVYLTSVLALAITLAVIFKDFGRLILFITAISLIVVFYFAHISLLECKFGKIILGKTVFAHSTKGLRITELYCPKENVGEIKIRRFLTDFSRDTCRIRITVRSESADSIRVRMLPYSEVKQEIYNCFGIKV